MDKIDRATARLSSITVNRKDSVTSDSIPSWTLIIISHSGILHKLCTKRQKLLIRLHYLLVYLEAWRDADGRRDTSKVTPLFWQMGANDCICRALDQEAKLTYCGYFHSASSKVPGLTLWGSGKLWMPERDREHRIKIEKDHQLVGRISLGTGLTNLRVWQ